MPYYVRGWIEATKFSPDERDSEGIFWLPLVHLTPFDLGADAISEYLFGLSKSAGGSGCFVERGVPDDCTAVVRHESEKNDNVIARYGEGDFGHTFATLEEIRVALSLPGAPRLDESAWGHILAATDSLLKAPSIEAATYLRVIVWANW